MGARWRREWNAQFQDLELRFLRQDLVDVRRQERVGFEDLAADGALHGGFDFGFGAGGYAVHDVRKREHVVSRDGWRYRRVRQIRGTYSFLNIMRVVVWGRGGLRESCLGDYFG